MAESTGPQGASQRAGSAQHQRIILQKQLAEVRMENTVLRQQLYQVSALLDIAVSKLGTMGVSLETPIDIRALRAEALKRAHAEVAAQEQYDAITASSPLSGGATASTHGTNKKFQMRQQLTEHTKAVQCCAFSDTEDPLIATGGMDCRVIVQNYFTGEKRWDAAAHEEAVSDIAWFDAHCLLSASYDNTVKLWDVNRGTSNKDVLYQYNTHGFVLSAIPLGPSLFACSDSRNKTAVVDVRIGGKSTVQEHDFRINSLSYDEAAHQLLMGQSNGVISIWDSRRGDQAVQITGNSSSASGPATGPQQGASGGAGGASSPPQQPHGNSPNDNSPSMAASVEGGGGGGVPLTTTTSIEDTAASAVMGPTNINSSAGSGGNPAGGPSSVVSTGTVTSGPPRFVRTTDFENEPSHASISYIAHFHSDDDTRRLICVSGDNMVRLYRGSLNAFTTVRADGANFYVLRNAMAGIPTRGNVMRSDFWKGERGSKSDVSVFFDDGEMDAVARPPRRLTECDLLVTGGPDNTAQVFDVTDEGNATVLERLDGHRDHVTGATVRRSRKPIIATTSADATVRIWVPVKS